MDFQELVKKRYSVRTYKEQMVEKEVILKLMETVRLAPSACNLQPLKFIVITDTKLKERISTEAYRGKWLQTAPVIIAVCGDHNTSWKRRDGKDHCDIDVAIAIDHLTLTAAGQGLGTCWVCAFDAALCHEILALPENLEVISLVPLGYPVEDSIPEKNRKTLEELCEFR